MWGFGKKSKKNVKSDASKPSPTPISDVSAKATGSRAAGPSSPFIPPMDPYGIYFSMPVECAGDFSDALKRYARRPPPCVESVSSRRGQPYKVYIRKSFLVVRNLVGALTGGHQFAHKGFRVRD